ncbi:PREDICTED: porimin-like isoform X1 [Priapulus caudatus]|uniref:Porimin-like isoform X1 n=1 Tax=Priapulus caudatus TaxID=37621 RepID=A0ABM1EYE0_PRICU|nr:PREDICTED: porimin-like isoform X1 [Priapulus caudatus]
MNIVTVILCSVIAAGFGQESTSLGAPGEHQGAPTGEDEGAPAGEDQGAPAVICGNFSLSCVECAAVDDCLYVYCSKPRDTNLCVDSRLAPGACSLLDASVSTVDQCPEMLNRSDAEHPPGARQLEELARQRELKKALPSTTTTTGQADPSGATSELSGSGITPGDASVAAGNASGSSEPAGATSTAAPPGQPTVLTNETTTTNATATVSPTSDPGISTRASNDTAPTIATATTNNTSAAASSAAPPTSSSSRAAAAAATEGAAVGQNFDVASFVGGIVLALGFLAIAFFGYKFYKSRTERNYQTL